MKKAAFDSLKARYQTHNGFLEETGVRVAQSLYPSALVLADMTIRQHLIPIVIYNRANYGTLLIFHSVS